MQPCARGSFRACLSLDCLRYPNRSWTNNALHLQEVGNLDYAIDCYETALSVDVHYAKAALQLGVLYRQKGGPHDLVLAQVHLLLLTRVP